jgi:hypothetical protein
MPEPISSLAAIAGIAAGTSNSVRFVLALKDCHLEIKQAAAFIKLIEGKRIKNIINDAHASVREVREQIQKVRPALQSDQIGFRKRIWWILSVKENFRSSIITLQAQQAAVRAEIDVMKYLAATPATNQNVNVTIHNVELLQLEYNHIAAPQGLLTAVDSTPSSSLLLDMPTSVPLLSSQNLTTITTEESTNDVVEVVEIPSISASEAGTGSSRDDIVEQLRLEWLEWLDSLEDGA